MLWWPLCRCKTFEFCKTTCPNWSEIYCATCLWEEIKTISSGCSRNHSIKLTGEIIWILVNVQWFRFRRGHRRGGTGRGEGGRWDVWERKGWPSWRSGKYYLTFVGKKTGRFDKHGFWEIETYRKLGFISLIFAQQDYGTWSLFGIYQLKTLLHPSPKFTMFHYSKVY